MYSSKKRIFLYVLIIVIAIGFSIPYETTLIPQYTLEVRNESGFPIKGIIIEQSWSSELISADRQSLPTDDNGLVTFQARKVKSAVLPRIISAIVNFPFKYVPHIGGGTYMFISFAGNSTYQGASFGGKYEDKNPPQEFILNQRK